MHLLQKLNAELPVLLENNNGSAITMADFPKIDEMLTRQKRFH